MNRKLLFFGAFLLVSVMTFGQTYIKLTLDTKKMTSLDNSLGGGSGVPATANKVYAHLGLCTCNLIGEGITATRDCSNETANKNYCLNQIKPYKSNVWQHVVGNWGENVQNDGVGEMTAQGNGVYSIEFVVEQYFSNPALVNTVSEAADVVPSQVWDKSKGGKPYTIGMVFRNEDGTLTGRDDLGSDLFIVNLLTTPTVIQGSDPEQGFAAITFAVKDTVISVQEIKNDKYSSVYPNPFSVNTQIEYVMPTTSNNMSLKIYNIVGKELIELSSGYKEAGNHKINWDGCSLNGEKLSSGIYYSVLNIDNKPVSTKKIIINR
jgi:hypothetical protein